MRLTAGEKQALAYMCDRMQALFGSGDTGMLEGEHITRADEDRNDQFCRDGESVIAKLRAEHDIRR